MKQILTLLFLFFSLNLAFSQTKHKVVMQLTTNDTKVFAGTIKNINHLLEALPGTEIELVCHSGGIQFILKTNSNDSLAIADFIKRGVKIVGCQNTLKGLNLSTADLHPSVGSVPSGVAEIVLKQEDNWTYLRQTP